MPQPIILASGSRFRRQLLEQAGVDFDVVKPDVDERAVEAALDGSGSTPEDVALILAEAKAQNVGERHSEALVIGSDQTLSLGDRIFHKPADMEDARRHLLTLSGKTHQLNSAVVIVRHGETIWSHVGIARLTMRELSPAFIGRHLSRVGERALESVGGYQIEAEGIQLFETVDGDHFTIVGLPLLPLLGELRMLGAIDA